MNNKDWWYLLLLFVGIGFVVHALEGIDTTGSIREVVPTENVGPGFAMGSLETDTGHITIVEHSNGDVITCHYPTGGGVSCWGQPAHVGPVSSRMP